MEQKENQRIKLTKRLLKESLLQLMEEKGIQKISVSELCKAAGINRATFYNHYSLPSDVLREIENTMAEEIQILLKEKKRTQENTIQESMEIACNYFLENKRTAKLLFQNNTPESEFAMKLIRGQEEWGTVCEDLIARYGNEGKELLFTFLVHGMYYMITKWLLEDVDKTPKEMGKLVSDFCKRGISV